jgi:Icc-related predicted phosphoesterase
LKILCVADTVEACLYNKFDAERFGAVDLVLSCGDLPPEYLSFLVSATGGPVYYVRGNHDIRYDAKPPLGAMDLHGRVVDFQGIRILGLEGSRWYNGGPCQYSDAQMRGMIRKLWPRLWFRKPVDLILTHAPPRGVHDREDLCHRGFQSFNRLIEQLEPRYFIHGHVHEHFASLDARTTQVATTKVINAYGHVCIPIDPEKAD